MYIYIHIHCLYAYVVTLLAKPRYEWHVHVTFMRIQQHSTFNGVYMSTFMRMYKVMYTYVCACVRMYIYIYYPSAWTIEASFMQSLLRKHSAIACHCHSPPLRRPSIRMGRHQSEYCQCIRVLKLPYIYIYKHINSNVHVYRESS